VVADHPQSVGLGEQADLSRRAPVVVAAELELGVAGVGQDLERARHVELVVCQQVPNGEHLDPDAIVRDVAALAEAVVVRALSTAATVTVVGPSETRVRSESAHRRRTAGGTDEATTSQSAPVDHFNPLLAPAGASPRQGPRTRKRAYADSGHVASKETRSCRRKDRRAHGVAGIVKVGRTSVIVTGRSRGRPRGVSGR
jgi:hypothetical protein